MKFCSESECIIIEDNDSYWIHYYDCELDEYDYEELEVEETGKTLNANVVLNTACSNVNARGDYSDDSVNCKEFICDATIGGKTYTKDCTVR
jgi:hypothetical protein